MAMGKGAKIAIGCGVAAVIAVIIAVGAVVGLGVWVKGKTEGMVANVEKTQSLEKELAEISYDRPADGVVSEDQLLRFLEVRKAAFSVYDANRALFDKRNGEEKPDFRDAMKVASVIQEIRAARLQAQVDQQMSEDEYNFLTESVYKTAWAKAFQDSTGGKSASQVAQESFAESREQMEKAMADEDLTEEQRQALAAGQQQLDAAHQQAAAAAAQLDIPAENIALFQKYEEEIQKYSMSGMELFGL